MLSESARMASAQEARYRVNYPNSIPRSIKVVALDEPSKDLVDEVSRLPWNKASFFTSLSYEGATPRAEDSSIKAWLSAKKCNHPARIMLNRVAVGPSTTRRRGNRPAPTAPNPPNKRLRGA